MKISLFSNFLNHHQVPVCDEFYKKFGNDFTFVATEPIPEERLNMGYGGQKRNYCLCSYESQESYDSALLLGIESDVVIIGSAPKIFIQERIKRGKLTFIYSERILKKGFRSAFISRQPFIMFFNHFVNKRKNVHLLCASAYTAYDFGLFRCYLGKAYKWGYFPEKQPLGFKDLIQQKSAGSEPIRLLWVGRFLYWKHPEKAIETAKHLKDRNFAFHLRMIGSGAEENCVKKLIEEYKLSEYVELLGNKKPSDVRDEMNRSDIFLFTSDKQEGWGAVLNEAMDGGCAVVASHEIGAVPFLLKYGESGLIYQNDDNNDLFIQVDKLIEDAEFRHKLGCNAKETIDTKWCAETAAEKIVLLAESLLRGKAPTSFKDGPCSPAERISEKEFGRMYKI